MSVTRVSQAIPALATVPAKKQERMIAVSLNRNESSVRALSQNEIMLLAPVIFIK
jgi:hypothetical protein